MMDLYREPGLDIYEKVHYGSGDHRREVEDILSWFHRGGARVLDIGCSGGLHLLEFAAKGFHVTGIDIETSAIARADKRAKDLGLEIAFHVLDIARDSMACLGTFDLIFSIGNVISHIDKTLMPEVLRKVWACLDDDGVFVFDALAISAHFPVEVHELDLGIIWKRSLNRSTGEIRLEGIYRDFGITQDFRVWGYTADEMIAMLAQAGFRNTEFSDKLNFAYLETRSAAPVCLRFRTKH
jgi:SAM-dependent methyltransferase